MDMYEARQNKEKVSRAIKGSGKKAIRTVDYFHGKKNHSMRNDIIQGVWTWWLSGSSKTNGEWKYFACDNYPNNSEWCLESKCPYKRPFHLTYLNGILNHITYYSKDGNSLQYETGKTGGINDILSKAAPDFRSEYANIDKVPFGPIRKEIDDTKGAIQITKSRSDGLKLEVKK